MQAWGPEEAQVGKGQRGTFPSTTTGWVCWPSRGLPLPSNSHGVEVGEWTWALVPSQLGAQRQPGSPRPGFLTLGRSSTCA